MEDISEKVRKFLEGHNPMERVVCIECGYDDDKASIIYNREDGEKRVWKVDFYPFVWAKESICVQMFGGDRKELLKKMQEFGITVKKLECNTETKKIDERLENGYKFMFYARKRMSWSRFQTFFNLAKTPIYPRKNSKTNNQKDFLAVSPVEQFMISSGIRLFKGYNGYDETKRMLFDIETTGLNPEKDSIDQIGIRTNKGYEKILEISGDTEEEKKCSEHAAIEEFVKIFAEEKPDVVAGHNSENFDWNFFIVKWNQFGKESFEDMSKKYLYNGIYKKKKDSVLKLGGEVEYFKPTMIWGTTVVDSLHAVRRAQAIDSDIKSANLKYVTKYLDLKKENRVYVPGDKIGQVWRETDNSYALNETNGDWYKITDTKPLEEGYNTVSGRYIVERYLLDDIYETDKVELTLNEANFLIAKMLPTTFQRACTMGTAGIWKLIMIAWCYENNLAIPSFGQSRTFTGGLSRLLKVGYVDRIVKLDYNSLYPSIMLTWWVANNLDITDSMLNMLDYVLTNREKYKNLKNAAGKKVKSIKSFINDNKDRLSQEEINKLKEEMKEANAEKNANDKKQSPLKVLGNSVFGSFGAPSIFPFGNSDAAERVTCIGRQCLRLMISHFNKLGYEPIVGDSFVGDTPLFIKYKDSGLIDIKEISELIEEKSIRTDILGRQYDTSKKDYYVLCRSGWCDVNYIYRHKTDKDIYEINDEKSIVDVTEDHSLFNENKEKIKPSEINEDTRLEYYNGEISGNVIYVENNFIEMSAKVYNNGLIDRLDYKLLNMNHIQTEYLLSLVTRKPNTKVGMAQIQYLKNKIGKK